MRRRFKKALSLLSAAAMCFSMALSLPEGTIGWGILANAEGGFDANGFGSDGTYEPAVETTGKYDVDGDGTKDNAYEISNAGQLYWFAGLVNGTLDGVKQNTLANAVLTTNITVNENLLDSLQYDTEGNVSNGSDFITWTPIADWMGNRTTQYSGTFDGNNKTVSGLYFNGDSTCIGLFGSSESDGNIKNVGVVDSYFKGNDHVGGVCGNNAGTITNCYNAGNLTAIESSATIGGICGYNSGTVTNCYNTGTVTATGQVASVGGVCGCSTAPISNCYNIGTVTATSSSTDISDICGYNFGPVTNCYYLADTEDEDGGKTAAQFASGEVAYLLSQGCTVGEGEDAVTYSGSVWGQNLATENYPIISGDRVYVVRKYSNCDKSDTPVEAYSNSQDDIVAKHNYINGFCKGCKGYEPAKLTTDKYDVDGDGINDSAYEISNAGQLYWFADFVNQGYKTRNAILTADIVVNMGVLDNDGNLVSETGSFRKWTPIGGNTLESDEDPEGIVNNYFGTFNGMKHTISGLYCVGDSEKVGLFGGIDSGKVIDVGVIDSYFKGNGYAGAITAFADRPIISGCFSKSTVIGSSGVGGICGYVSDYYIKGSISDCYNAGVVSGDSSVGGICGDSVTNIYASYNTGKVSGTKNIGGIIGNSDSSIVKDCYNSGDITASKSNVGGIAGWTRSSIETCYNTGSVSGKGYVGGIAGNADKLNRNDIVVNNCYNSGCVKAFGTEPQVDCVGGITGTNDAVVKSCYNIGNVSGGIYDDDNVYLLHVSFISGYGMGDIDNCYYLEGCAENGDKFNDLDGASKTDEEFTSGEVAYYLNFYGDKADLWKQTLDEQDRPNFTGKTVYATKEYSGCKDAPGEFTLSFNNEGEQTIYADHTDSNNDGSCDYCKKLIEKLAGATVSLDSAIGLNFFMELSDVIASSDETYMLFTLKDGETRKVSISDALRKTNEGKTYYVFTCELAAKEMSDIVMAQLFFGEKAGEEYTYSVKEYAESIIANKKGDYNDESIALAKAMLNYGANSQTYFEYKTDDLANSDLSDDDKALSTTTNSIADHKFTISSNKKVCTFVSAYLSLESKTKVNVYVDLADGVNVDNVTFRVKGDEVKPTMKNGHYLLTVDGIEFPNLGDKFTFEVKYNNEKATLEYGALSFCYTVLGSSKHSQNIKDVSAALGDVYSAAVKYVEKKMAS